MKRNSKQKNKGFIALMSSVIMSVILILIIVNTSLTGFNNRFNILDSEIKEMSSALADSCIDILLLGLAQNPAYSGNVNVPVGSNSCSINLRTTSGGNIIFKTRGIFNNSYTNLKVTVNGTNFSIVSVEETPT